jgi:RNA polymerase sigma-70 factor (ECF subfamily)
MPLLDRAGISAAISAGNTRWPEIALRENELGRYLERLRISDQVLRLRSEDLFLAAACAAGDPAALRALDTDYLASIAAFLRPRMKVSEQFADEARQAARIKLLLDQPPRIAGYDGSSPLRVWLQVATVRIALDMLRSAARQPRPIEPAHLERLAVPAGAEGDLIKGTHGPQFKAALEEALAGLSNRDKAVLRFHFVEGLNIEAIGTIYRVHRATVARWLVEIRSRVFATAREKLAVDLRLSPSELRSLLGLVREELHLSISRVLGDGKGAVTSR